MRIPLLAALIALAIGLAPANARGTKIEVTHTAPLPCTIVCPYYDAPEALGYSPCAEPFPKGSWDETTFRFTRTTPDAAFYILAMPYMDYDTFVCSDTQPRVEVASFNGLCCAPCEGPVGPTPAFSLGCGEDGTITYMGLKYALGYAPEDPRFVLMSYNWSDVGSNHITLEGDVELVSDDFTADPLP